MDANNHLLKIVTNEIKSSIQQLEIVTPTLFATLYCELAQKNGISLEGEERLALELIHNECASLMDLQSKTSQNTMKLSDSTTKAIDAIKNKDDSALSEVFKETQVLKEEIEKLKETVYTDALTKTFNRKWLQDNLIDSITNKSKRSGVLSLIDLNDFKIINDTHGHIIGDKILVFIAKEFMNIGFDVVRYGGDEFLLIFPSHITQDKANEILLKTRADILHKKFKTRNETFSINFSFGIAPISKETLFSEALDIADQKMYKDKERIKKRHQK